MSATAAAVATPAPTVRKLSTITKQVAAFKKKYDIEHDCTKPEGYKKAKAKFTELKAIRVEAEKARKNEKAEHLAAGNAVDAENNKILKYIEPREAKYRAAYTAIDSAKAKAKQDKIDAEKAEADAMQARFDELDDLAIEAHSLPEALAAIEKLDTLDLQPFQDRSDDAIEKVESLLKLMNNRKARLETEAVNAAEVERQREANEQAAAKIKADQDAADTKIREAQEAADKRKHELDERERKMNAEADKVKAAADATAAAEKKAEADKVKAAEQAKQDQAEAVANTKREAEAKEAKRIADEQAAADAEAKRLADEAEAAALAPDIDKLQTYIDAIGLIEAPVMTTKHGEEMLLHITRMQASLISQISEIIQTGNNKKAAA